MGLEIEVLRFLMDIALMFLVALLLGLIANKLGQPAMLGYLFAGMVLGPYSWSGLINDIDEINALAMLGVSLLLFVVGLEFSPKRLKNIWKPSVFCGTFEMVMMFFIGIGTGHILGWSLLESMFLGAMLMMSSTVIIIKNLTEIGQIDTLHGRLLIGMLIIEDIGAIITITLISSMAGSEQSLFLRFMPLIIGIISLISVIVIGRKVFPKLLEGVRKSPSKELFLLAVFGICICVAVLSEFLGLSIALGAFLAGVVLSESDHHLDIISRITPLKDVFMIIFFVSVGMTMDPAYIIENPIPVIVLVIVLLAGKSVANILPTRIMGFHPKTTLHVGMGMLQIGEFSFIIASMGLGMGLISFEVYSSVIATALISMVLTPYAMRSTPDLYKWLVARGHFLSKPGHPDPDKMEDDSLERLNRIKAREKNILLLGYAEVSVETLECLDLIDMPYTVVDYDPKKMKELREREIDCIYGDASNEEVLKLAGVEYAHLIIVAISDTLDSEMAIARCHEMNPGAYIIARAYGNFDKERISKYTDDVIISEEVAGKRMAWHVLRNLGLDEASIRQDIEIVERAPLSPEDEDAGSS